MKTRIILVALMLGLITIPALAQVPSVINYQGKLTDKKGVPLNNIPADPTDGQINITFSIWDSDTGGNILWEEIHNDVAISKGLFSILLGTITEMDSLDIFPEDTEVTRWLEVTITAIDRKFHFPPDDSRFPFPPDGDIVKTQTLSPRKEIASVVYAMKAGDADTVDRYEASGLLSRVSHTGTQPPSTISPQGAGSELDADTVDGLHASDLAGVTDHGALTGLEDDDHPQYLTEAEHAGIDTNLGEEAPGATERGEPTGEEIQQWADDITTWGHTNVVTGLNADRVDSYEAISLLDRANHTGVQLPSSISPQGTGSNLDADKIDAFHASSTPTANYLYPLGSSAKFPTDILYVGTTANTVAAGDDSRFHLRYTDEEAVTAVEESGKFPEISPEGELTLSGTSPEITSENNNPITINASESGNLYLNKDSTGDVWLGPNVKVTPDGGVAAGGFTAGDTTHYGRGVVRTTGEVPNNDLQFRVGGSSSPATQNSKTEGTEIMRLTQGGNLNVTGNIDGSNINAAAVTPNNIGTTGQTVFFGNGANLTNLNADQLASGTVPNARLDPDLQDLAIDGELSATSVQFGDFFINTAGTDGQVWKSDGVGAGYWGTDNDTDTNNFVNGINFNTANGDLTLTLSGLPDLVQNLDGRYLTATVPDNDWAFVGNDIHNANIGNVGIGTTAPSQELHVAGDMRLTGGLFDTNNEVGTNGQILSSTGSAVDWIDPPAAVGGVIPIGGIIMWSGAIANIPVGWHLCDGNNGTPNLTGRFVIHADADAGGTYNPGDSGGENEVTLTESEMPSHMHHFALGLRAGEAGAAAGTGPWSDNSGPTSSKGSDQPHENRPPYYALAYIMRIS